MTIKRVSADEVADHLTTLIQEADLDLLAEIYSRYCVDDAVVVYIDDDGSVWNLAESYAYEHGDPIATDESRSNGPRM